MTDYALKSSVLKSGLIKVYRDVRKSLWYNFDGDQKKYTKYSFESALTLDNDFRKMYPIEWNECSKISHNDFKRKLRLKKRIKDIIEEIKEDKYIYFVTLTFSDSTLDSTSAITRRRYVSRFLKDIGLKYVANIDFGGQNNREHYHAVLSTISPVNYAKMAKKWGNGIKFEKIRLSNDNRTTEERLAKYISKLTNHAIKETTKRSVIIYSR